MTISSASVVSTRRSDSAGSTRTRIPPWPLAATAMLPFIRNARPPNIFCSVTPLSPETRSRMRAASSSSYAIGRDTRSVSTMADLDELALALPQATKELSDDGRPAYKVHGKLFCCQRGRRPDALDEHGDPLADLLMFSVAHPGGKELL